MRPHALNRRVASGYFGDNGVVVARIKPSLVANLPTGVGIKRRVIENHFARLASLKFPHALPVMDYSQHLAPVGASLTIAFENRFRQLLIRRVGGLFCATFPRGASASALLRQCAFEAFWVKFNAPVSTGILNKVEGHAVGAV